MDCRCSAAWELRPGSSSRATSGVGAAGEETVVGDTPNLAARLQSAAEPDCVLVSPSTHQLTGDFFDYSFLGEQAIKGFSEPVLVWKALRESATESRFAAAHAAAAGPMVGRERELAFLYDSWQRATRGDGQSCCWPAKPGWASRDCWRLLPSECGRNPIVCCAANARPITATVFCFRSRRLLRHRLDIGRDLSTQENMDRIGRTLERVGRHSRSSRCCWRNCSRFRSEDTLSPIEMTPNQRKNETLAIVEDLLMMSLDGPVLLLLEDAHWSDQTTQTLIERLLKRIGREHALVLITHRPELKTNWSEHAQAHANQLQANRARSLRRLDPASRQANANGRFSGPGNCRAKRRRSAVRPGIDQGRDGFAVGGPERGSSYLAGFTDGAA